LECNGREITPEYITGAWINGFYFHSDPEKIAILEGLAEPGGQLARQVFLGFVTAAIKQVIFLANTIIFARREGLLH